MTYVITNLCTNDGACVEVCPVACIHTTPGAPQFYIDPEVCIDCEQCEIVCPVDAIFRDTDLLVEHEASIEVNAVFFRKNKAAVEPVSVEKAWRMIHAAHAYAGKGGISVTAAVVDEAGFPIAVGRMDGADPKSVEIAYYKAYTSAAFHISTEELLPQSRRPWFRSLVVSHRGRLLPEGGGIAIIDGAAIVGAVGVAGARRPDQDILCSQAALAALDGDGH